MKQPVAILLILIHLFNTGGYRFVFDQLEERSSVELIKQLDNETYRDSELVEMKVALPMPYQTNWSSFERFNGEIEIAGIHYNYVKRKVWNDTLILMCIPNHGKMSLNSAKDQFFSLVNDLDQKGKDVPAPKSNIAKNITTDFQSHEPLPLLTKPQMVRVDHVLTDASKPSSIALDAPLLPPESIG